MSTQVEELDLPHGTYSKLVDAKLFEVEEIVKTLLDKTDDRLAALSNEELVLLSKAMSKFSVQARDKRAEFVLGSTTVNEIIVEGVKWQDIVRATVKSYEFHFGIGDKVSDPSPAGPKDEIDQAVKAISGVMKKHGVGERDD